MNKTPLIIVVLTVLLTTTGCATMHDHSGEGASIGGVLGALAGGIIGHQSGRAGEGVLAGAVLGAAGGAILGTTVAKPAPAYAYAQPAMVEPTPVIVTQVPEALTVNVPNRRVRGYTTVTLRRSGTGYVGPQGEYYDQFPPIEQLRLMYGA